MKQKIKYRHSKEEQEFYKYMNEKHPELKITKKGFPDFMIINKENKIIGFIEVKRSDLSDGLRKEQKVFRDFCKEKGIPYQVWSSIMRSNRWAKANPRFKKAMMYADEAFII